MRLYAYGGTGFVERARVGAWLGLTEAVLSSTDDVRGGESFGVGLAKEGPHLIYRTFIPDRRDGYAYTLLLGPAEQTWQVFGWNAAALLQALLAAGGTMLMQPDRVSQTSLEELETEICERGMPQTETGRGLPQWTLACVGAGLGERAVVAAPQDFGWVELPDLAGMARVAAEIEPCFRIGGGWLVGGAEMAKMLRCALVLSAAATPGGQVEEASRRGQRFVDGWRRLPVEVRGPEEVTPMHRWAYTAALDAAFAAMVKLEKGEDAAPECKAGGTPFEQALERHAETLLRSQLGGGQTVERRSTEWLLARLEGQALGSLSAQDAAGLDPGACAAFLRRHRVPPNPSRVIPLSADQAVQLAGEFLAELRPLTVASHLACCSFLAAYEVDGLTALGPQLEAAVLAGRTTLSDLLLEASASSDPRAAQVAEMLRRVLRGWMQESASSAMWLREVVRAGLWDRKAAECLLRAGDGDAAIRELIEHATDAAVQQWLDRLASDPLLRPRLSVATKGALADVLAAPASGWNAFRAVKAWFLGSRDELPEVQPGDPERGWLREELLQLAEEQDQVSLKRLPNLDQLHAYLDLPPELVAALDQGIRPRLGFFRRLLWGRKVAALEAARSKEHKGRDR